MTLASVRGYGRWTQIMRKRCRRTAGVYAEMALSVMLLACLLLGNVSAFLAGPSVSSSSVSKEHLKATICMRTHRRNFNERPAAERRKCSCFGLRDVVLSLSARAPAGEEWVVDAAPTTPTTKQRVRIEKEVVLVEASSHEGRPQKGHRLNTCMNGERVSKSGSDHDRVESRWSLAEGNLWQGDGAQPAAVLAAVAVLTALFWGYEHGAVGLDWIGKWPSPSATASAANDAARGANMHFTPLKSLATGAGAGLTRAVSRTFTFPLDTIKTRRQVSRLRPEDRSALPEGMCRVIDQSASFEGVFRGFTAFLVQAAPANAIFFLFYDALNTIGASTLLTNGEGIGGFVSYGFLSTAVHLGASSFATVPCNLVRTPAEVVKQRLQVGQESGSTLTAVQSIVKSEGMGGLFVGGKEQLMREIPFNAVQFTIYECLKSCVVLPELWTDAALGAASSSAAALATQPIDAVKTRVMTKSVPGAAGTTPPGFLKSAASVIEAEGISALFLGLLPRMALVSTGGAFYFWGQEFAAQLLSRAGL